MCEIRIARYHSPMSKLRETLSQHDHRHNLILLVLTLFTVIWSGAFPHDRKVWFMEITPVITGVVALVVTYRTYRFTRMSYNVVFIAAILIAIGGHFTFERVPFGIWAKEYFGTSRNHYDRAGHFMQGVFSALLIREMVVRRSGVRRGRWLFMLVSSSSLAIAALFEFAEWFVAVTVGDGSQAYLATQGDEWDAHWDMLLAFIGSILVQLTLARFQDKQLRERGLALDK